MTRDIEIAEERECKRGERKSGKAGSEEEGGAFIERNGKGEKQTGRAGATPCEPNLITLKLRCALVPGVVS